MTAITAIPLRVEQALSSKQTGESFEFKLTLLNFRRAHVKCCGI